MMLFGKESETVATRLATVHDFGLSASISLSASSWRPLPDSPDGPALQQLGRTLANLLGSPSRAGCNGAPCKDVDKARARPGAAPAHQPVKQSAAARAHRRTRTKQGFILEQPVANILKGHHFLGAFLRPP